MLTAITKLFISIASAEPKVKDPEVMTNFLTESDLNSWFVKIMGVLALPVALQLWSIWRESKKDTSKDIKELKSAVHDIKIMFAEMRGEARTIARMEAEKVLEIYERARR